MIICKFENEKIKKETNLYRYAKKNTKKIFCGMRIGKLSIFAKKYLNLLSDRY